MGFGLYRRAKEAQSDFSHRIDIIYWGAHPLDRYVEPYRQGKTFLHLGTAMLSFFQMMTVKSTSRPLQFCKPSPPQGRPPVHVEFAIDGKLLIAKFEVTCSSIYAKKELARNEHPYEFDVVELFVTASDNPATAPYYEFEVSPFNQSLQVNVIEPRREFYFGVKNGFEHSARLTPGGWVAEMRIPLQNIGHNGLIDQPLYGNAYAILGEGDQRLYWSLFELPRGKPDFHVPTAFRKF